MDSRLWASSGQRSLEQANVLLIGHDATGSQAIKNLVLPGEPAECIDWQSVSVWSDSVGIASFTICSEHVTTAKDVATNFFLQESSVGQPIASELVKYDNCLGCTCRALMIAQVPLRAQPRGQGLCPHRGRCSAIWPSCAEPQDGNSMLHNDPDDILKYSLVIVSNIDPQVERCVADSLWKRKSSSTFLTFPG